MQSICPHFLAIFGFASFYLLGLQSPSQTANKGTVSSKECSERRESQVTAVRAHYSFVSIASVTFWALDDGTFTDFMRFL